MIRLKLFLSTYRLPILTGILIGTSYIPFPPWASCFAFVPLWIFLRSENSAKKVFFGAWLSSFILTLIGFNWVALTIHQFGHMPWPVSIAALIAFCGFANLDVPLASILWFIIKKRSRMEGFASLALLALMTAICERHFPTIFAWNYGFTFFWSGLPVAQLAELIGFQGISTLVILGNLGAYHIWQERHSPKRNRAIATFIGAFLLLNGAGWGLKKTLPLPDRKLRPLVVQGNIGNLEKQVAERGSGFRDYIVQKYISMTRTALSDGKGQIPKIPKADFVVWPETAFPVTVYAANAYDPYLEVVKSTAREVKTPLVIGGYGEEPAQGKTTNSLYVINHTGQVQWPPYSKSILLAFGEYLPFYDSLRIGKLFPTLRDRIPVGDFGRGPGPISQILPLAPMDGGAEVGQRYPMELKFGPQICYEGLFPMFAKKLADSGAEVVINVTNDSWFGFWQEPYQHLYMTLARAIEFRRPVIRSTNTGISTVALADGTVLEKSPLHKEWTHIYDVPYRSAPSATLYQQIPWLMDALLIILGCALIGIPMAMTRGYFARAPQSGLGRN